MALVKISDDIWLQSDLVILVERNTTSGAIEVSYFVGSSIATVTITGVKLDQVVAKIQPPPEKQ